MATMKITKAQASRIQRFKKLFGMNEKLSGIDEKEGGAYYFKTAYGDGNAWIQRDGEVTGGNLGYFVGRKKAKKK